MQPDSRAFRRVAPCWLVTAIALSTGVARADDPNPYYIGGTVGITHDSNISRVPNGTFGGQTFAPVSDTYYSAGLIAGIDQPFGRQHFTASGNVKYNRFSHETSFDNTSYGLDAELDWQAIDRLSGVLSAALSQNLASYAAGTLAQPVTKKNVERSTQFSASAEYGLRALLSTEGLYRHQQLSYSADVYQQYDISQDSLRLGLKYRPSGLLTLGAYIQGTSGRYPHPLSGPILPGLPLPPAAPPLDYHRTDFTLTGYWIATGQSTLDARISATRQSYDETSASSLGDFTSATGQLVWTYKPTGKLTFTTTLLRDTGIQAGFASQQGDTSRLTNSVALAATYAATGKISLNGGLRYAHRSLKDPFPTTATTVNDGTDNIQSQYLGLTYNAARSVQIACTASHDARTVSDKLSIALSYPYTATTFGCSAQLTLQ
ncbi:MAG: hypothetical protein JSR59_11305 [Proteobacteria bacterium]|nr:hypothetical protein [Pseudomonadota bacterium]